MPPHPKYARVTARLRTLAPGQDGLRLTFRELERLAGPLPQSAWCSAYWRKGGVARVNWGRVGFVALLDRHAEAVTFRRTAAGPGAPENARPPGRAVADGQLPG
jgi:hypothetical protein